MRSPSQGVPGHNPSPCIKRHRTHRTPDDAYSLRAHQRCLRVLSWAEGRHSGRCLFVCPATHPLTYFPHLPVPAKPTKLQIFQIIIQTAEHSNIPMSFCYTKSNILKNIRDLTTKKSNTISFKTLPSGVLNRISITKSKPLPHWLFKSITTPTLSQLSATDILVTDQFDFNIRRIASKISFSLLSN